MRLLATSQAELGALNSSQQAPSCDTVLLVLSVCLMRVLGVFLLSGFQTFALPRLFIARYLLEQNRE